MIQVRVTRMLLILISNRQVHQHHSIIRHQVRQMNLNQLIDRQVIMVQHPNAFYQRKFF